MKKLKNIVVILLSACILMSVQGCNNNKQEEGTLPEGSGQSAGKSNNNESGSKADLKGSVTSIKDNVITISKVAVNSKGNTVDSLTPKNSGKKPEKNVQNVKVTDSTQITVKKTRDRINFSESKGSMGDITVDSFVEVNQKKDGSEFVATKITVYINEQ